MKIVMQVGSTTNYVVVTGADGSASKPINIWDDLQSSAQTRISPKMVTGLPVSWARGKWGKHEKARTKIVERAGPCKSVRSNKPIENKG